MNNEKPYEGEQEGEILHEMVKDDLRYKVGDIAEKMVSTEDHIRRLRTYLKKRIAEMENLKVQYVEIIDAGGNKSEALRTQQDINELLQRLYLAHQDQKITDEQVGVLNKRIEYLANQFPQYFDKHEDFSQN